MIADRVIKTRAETWEDDDRRRPAAQPHARHRLPRRRDARHRGELPDQEVLHRGGRGVDREPGPHMTLLHGPRSGDLVRARRRHHVPAGPAELRLHPDHGLEHGRAAPGRLPVGDRGQGARREGDPRRPALHAHERDGRPARAAARRAPTSRSSAGSSTTSSSTAREFREYVRSFTNAPRDHQATSSATPSDARRLLLGLEPGRQRLRDRRAGATRAPRASRPRASTSRPADVSGDQAHGAHGHGARPAASRPRWTETLEHPSAASSRSLKRHFARYTPEMVERGLRRAARASSSQVAEALCENSGRERTSGDLSTRSAGRSTRIGVQNIRAASIIQLLLGNIGRPGGGILALRGHANIQGSTDIPTLYDILPGYIPMPHPQSQPTPRRRSSS